MSLKMMFQLRLLYFGQTQNFNLMNKFSNLTAPFDLVVFPSMGLFYDNKKAYVLVKYLTGIEENILTIIRDNNIKSKNHLLGYALNYQGYYGYGDLQLLRIIDKLSIFFVEGDEKLKLNRKGHEALLQQHNFAIEIDNNIPYGGVNRFDFQFSTKQNKLIKTVINAY